MAIGTHKVPKETKEATTKWAKFFSTGQLAVLIVQVIIDYLIFNFFLELGLQYVGLFIDLTLTAVVGIIVMGYMPPSKYLFASGLPFWRILARVIMRKFKHKYIYVRGVNREENSEVQKGEGKWGLSRLFQNM